MRTRRLCTEQRIAPNGEPPKNAGEIETLSPFGLATLETIAGFLLMSTTPFF